MYTHRQHPRALDQQRLRPTLSSSGLPPQAGPRQRKNDRDKTQLRNLHPRLPQILPRGRPTTNYRRLHQQLRSDVLDAKQNLDVGVRQLAQNLVGEPYMAMPSKRHPGQPTKTPPSSRLRSLVREHQKVSPAQSSKKDTNSSTSHLAIHQRQTQTHPGSTPSRQIRRPHQSSRTLRNLPYGLALHRTTLLQQNGPG